MRNLLQLIDGAGKPSDLVDVLDRLLEPLAYEAYETVAEMHTRRTRLPRFFKRLARRLSMKAGYIPLQVRDAVDWLAVKWSLYAGLGLPTVQRLFDIMRRPGDWDRLYEELDEEGKRNFMAWLKASLAFLLARPSEVFRRWPGLDSRSYYLRVIELRDACGSLRQPRGVERLGVCEFRVRGLRGTYTVYTTPALLLDIWHYETYPAPRENSVVVDVGAFTGETSLWFYDRGAAKVYAIEPLPEAYRLLEAAVRVNRLEDAITPIMAALGREEGTAIVTGVGASAKVVSDHSDSEESGGNRVRVTTLDALTEEYGLDRVDYIKLDVEGYEEDVLSGAARVLRSSKPMVAAAVYHKARQPITVWMLLKRAGYTRFTFLMRTPKIYDVVLVAMQ